MATSAESSEHACGWQADDTASDERNGQSVPGDFQESALDSGHAGCSESNIVGGEQCTDII